LKPITLTDAFGCDRCPLMFVIEDSGHSLVQLGGIDPYRRAWQWNGAKWQASHDMKAKFQAEVLPTQLLIVSVTLMMLLLLLSLNMKLALVLPLALIATTPLILVFWWWLLLRRRH
jgi:hypothetical protein